MSEFSYSDRLTIISLYYELDSKSLYPDPVVFWGKLAYKLHFEPTLIDVDYLSGPNVRIIVEELLSMNNDLNTVDEAYFELFGEYCDEEEERDDDVCYAEGDECIYN